MNDQQIPDSRAAILTHLNASIESFFGYGGSVEILPGAGYVPHRPRREPD